MIFLTSADVAFDLEKFCADVDNPDNGRGANDATPVIRTLDAHREFLEFWEKKSPLDRRQETMLISEFPATRTTKYGCQ